VVKRDDCPQYKESFNFRLEETDFDKAGLKVTCLQHLPILERGERLKRERKWEREGREREGKRVSLYEREGERDF